MTRVRKTTKRVLSWVAVAAVLVTVAAFSRGWSFFADDRNAPLAGAEVRRGNLLISVTERGNLKARDSVSMKSEIEGRSTVLWLVPEGTVVAPGDKVAELDASNLTDNRVQQEISVQNADAAWIKAVESLAIQRLQNESDIAKARQQLDFARQDLNKYIEGDHPQKLQQAEEDIVLAEEELKRAEEKLRWSRELFDKGFVQRTELEGDELSHQRAIFTLDRARRSQELLVDYDHPRQLAMLEAGVEEAERELRRTELQAASRLVDYETAVRTSKSRLNLEEEKLAKLERQIQKSVLHAPVAGMVVYGREEGGRSRGDAPVSIGGEVRERQEILSIPGASGMIVEASVHESVLKQVRVGQECIVRVDAIPGRDFRGHVTFVAPLPDQNSWWMNPNLRVYRTEVAIEEITPEMRPGMSSSIEILIDELRDVRYVPLQAVTNQRGRNLVFVKKGERVETREVEVGPHNAKWVSIGSGLREGEIVLLSPPPGFEMRGEEPERDPRAPDEMPQDLPPAALLGGERLEAGAGGARPEAGSPRPRGARGPGTAGGERPARGERPAGSASPAQGGDSRAGPGESAGGGSAGGGSAGEGADGEGADGEGAVGEAAAGAGAASSPEDPAPEAAEAQ